MITRSSFYVGHECEALLLDGKWHRGVIQGGPHAATTGGTFYNVHMHYPDNRLYIVFSMNLRAAPNSASHLALRQHSTPIAPKPSASLSQAITPANLANTANQGCALVSQPLSQTSNTWGQPTPSEAAKQPVIPSKRRPDSQPPVISSKRTQAIQSALHRAAIASNLSHPPLQPASNTPTIQAAVSQSGGTSPPHMRPPLAL